MLRRQPRTRTRKLPHLQVIEEESDLESRSSSSSSSAAGSSRGGSPAPDVKARRRNARLSSYDIKLASTILSDFDLSAAPFTPTRAAPSPPPRRPDSDEFSIIFTEKEFMFPHPPTAYTYSSAPSSPSSCYSSPSSESSALPGTPTTTDDELATTQPLHIEKKGKAPASESEDSDSDLEDAYEWYSRELAEVVDMKPATARGASPGSRPRPESIYVASTSSTRVVPGHMPSPQLDPQYPRRTFVIPKRAPPPPPVERTPPRGSMVPEDLVIDDLLDEYFYSPSTSPSQSEFSDSGLLEDIPFLLEEEDAEDDDAPIQLPLCLPTSPFALDFEEFDTIGQSLEPVASAPEDSEDSHIDDSESHILRSRWSSSTLDSAYSAGAASPKSRLMKIWAARAKHMSSPKSPKTPKISKHAHSHSMSSYLASPKTPYYKFRPEEVAAVDYANAPPTASSARFPSTPVSPAHVKRSPSRQSCSSADSGDSSASSGLRRKPIPVEMFLRA